MGFLKQDLHCTKIYEQTSAKEKSVINHHIFQNATRFAVSVDEDQERLPTFYWLPNLHKHLWFDLFLIPAHARVQTIKIANLLSHYIQKSCSKIL